MISEKLQKARAKFKSKPQMLQFLAKEYANQFLEFSGPHDFYRRWKKDNMITSATQLSDEDLDKYITEFETSLDWNTP